MNKIRSPPQRKNIPTRKEREIMTVKKIVEQIDARIDYLKTKRNDLESKRNWIRYEKPWRDMTDNEIEDLPRKSKFWTKNNEYREKISKVETELSVLRDMRYAYEQTPYRI